MTYSFVSTDRRFFPFRRHVLGALVAAAAVATLIFPAWADPVEPSAGDRNVTVR